MQKSALFAQTSALQQPRDTPIDCSMALLENNDWPTSKHSIINWTWPLTNEVISGFHRSHDQMINA
jgi:hypothetical protein